MRENKEKKITMSAYIPFSLHEKLKVIAEKQERSVSYVIIKILKEYVEKK